MNEIIYIDNAATMPKAQSVIDAQVDFLSHNYANAGRGVCARAVAADDMVCAARNRVAALIGATENQIVFTSGATDGLNRVVRLVGGEKLRVAVSDLDHNSARVPWQMRANTEIILWPLDEKFNIDVARVPMADVYVITAMSNVLGGVQNVAALVRAAREKNNDAVIIVDAAQYVAHEKIDAAMWDADFICFSGHKIGADTGLGVMYVKNPARWAPDKFGGGMVARADGDKIYFNDAPHKFEAGTLPLTQISGLISAIDFLEKNPIDLSLIKYARQRLAESDRVKILTAADSVLLSFAVHDMHAYDLGALLGARGVCVRVGNMCAPWIHRVMGIDASVRISVGPQNTMEQMQRAMDILMEIITK